MSKNVTTYQVCTMKKVFSILIGALLLTTTRIYGQGMPIDVFHFLTTKSDVKLADVLERAGEPDLIRRGPFGEQIFLYYIGNQDGYGSRKTTTVIVDGKTDRVIKIERIR